MAAYNAAKYITEAIESILHQTFEDFELLIVNDGSTDNTVAIINKFHDPRIRLIHNDRNRGLVFTRNVLLEEARGEYIAILDSDDIAISNRLALQYEHFKKHPELALCGGHGQVINHSGDTINDPRLIVPIGPENIKITLLFLNTFVNSTVMYKKEVLLELNGYNDFAPAEDYELFIRIADKYAVDNIDTVLVKYRDHDHNTSVVQVSTGSRKVHEIKKNQLNRLHIEADQRLIEVFYSVLAHNFEPFDFSDYLSLFWKLKSANQKLKIYPKEPFEKRLFEYWFKIIMIKKAKGNALALLFSKKLFNFRYLTAKQFRKTFKLSLRGIGTLSK
ncbi:glycosyltransferase involved in cell wall biosynthesis [Pedobacter sp. CAN_A7]